MSARSQPLFAAHTTNTTFPGDLVYTVPTGKTTLVKFWCAEARDGVELAHLVWSDDSNSLFVILDDFVPGGSSPLETSTFSILTGCNLATGQHLYLLADSGNGIYAFASGSELDA